MYQNIYIEKPKQGKPVVHIWDDVKGYEKFQFTPYAYQKSASGTYRSLYGDKLKKVMESFSLHLMLIKNLKLVNIVLCMVTN